MSFPLGGVVRSFAYQLQAPFTTQDCSNVWPHDPLEDRDRGGTRQGLSKAFTTLMGNGQPVQLMESVAVVSSDFVVDNELLVIAGGASYYSALGAEPVQIPNGRNLARDYSFEEYTLGSPDTWDYWDSSQGTGGAVEVETTAGNYYHGSAGVKFTEGTAGATISTAATDTTITPGATGTVRLQYWTKGDGSGQVYHSVIENAGGAYLTDTDGNSLQDVASGVTGTDWTQVTEDILWPDTDGKYITLSFRGPQGAGSTVAYLDKVTLHAMNSFDDENLKFNPSLEIYSGNNFTGWTESGDPEVSQTSIAQTGNSAAKLTADGVTGSVFIRDAVTVEAETSYRVTFWTRGDGGTGDITYGFYDVSNGAYIPVDGNDTNAVGNTTTTYAKVSKDITTPAGCTSVQFRFFNDASNTDEAYLDDLVIRKLDAGSKSWLQYQAAARQDKIYIADYRRTRLVGTDGVIGASNVLSANSISDWTALDIDVTRDVIVIADSTGGTDEDDAYRILSVAAGGVTLDLSGHTDLTGNLTAGTCSWELGRQIQVYDSETKSIDAIEVTYGMAPVNCPLICLYRDRIACAQGNTWYMSRQGDPTDWDYTFTATDMARPVSGSVVEAAGLVAQPVLALIPHSDDYLIFGCERSIWMLRGDAGGGGQIDAISRSIGILGPEAWCKMPNGTICVLSRQGLYIMSPGGASPPQELSRNRLPRELLDTDMISNSVTLHYDGSNQGVHVFVTPYDESAGSHWFVSVPDGGFYPVSLPATKQPMSLLEYAAGQGDAQAVLQGDVDGYIRKYDATATDDDGTAITSYVDLGPFRLAEQGRRGVIQEFAGVLDEDSAGVTWSIYTGDTAEAAVDDSTATNTGSWVAGRNRPVHPRAGGGASVITLTGTGMWAFESAYAILEDGGPEL